MIENWRDIKDFEGRYQVSDLGRVKSLSRKVNSISGGRVIRERILQQVLTSYGYLAVSLGEGTWFIVHRLIAKTFLSNPENKLEVNHKNGIKTDNRVINIEWVTRSENMQHSVNTGLYTVTRPWLGKFGSEHNRSKKVFQYKEGSLIAEYGSGFEASRETGISNKIISKCCLGQQKAAGGFTWKYQSYESN